MIKRIKKFFKEEESGPFKIKERHECPFYGFKLFQKRFFWDLGGNSCGLLNDRPCFMKHPDWNACSLNCPMAKKAFKEGQDRGVTVMAEEFNPHNDRSWGGVSIGRWMDYVMSPDVPRPPLNKD